MLRKLSGIAIMDLKRLYKCIPYLLILFATGAIIYSLRMGTGSVLNTGTICIFVAFIIGSLFIIFAKKHHPESIFLDTIACLNIPQRTLRRCFLIAASILLIVVLLGFRNSFIYILLLAVACICIILQILSRNVSAPWVIFQILYVTGILIFPHIFAYPYYFSDSDIIYHTYFAQTIIDTGFMNTLSSSGGSYASFPGFHLLLAVSSLLSALSANVCDYLFLKIGYLCLSIFIYLLVKQFFRSETAGLLALFIFLIGTFATPRYTWGQPSVLLAALSLLLLYLIFRNKAKEKVPFIILAIPIVLFAMISHHANHLPLIGIIFVILLTDVLIIPLISRHKNWREHSTNIGIALLYLLPCIAYLCYTYLPKILDYINKFFSSLLESGLTAIPIGTGQTTIIGGVRLIPLSKDTGLTNMMSDAGQTLNGISGTSANIDILNTAYNWLSSSYIWLCIIPALVGMYFLLTGRTTSRKQYLLGFIMLVFFIIFSTIGSLIPGFDQFNIYRFHDIIAALFMGGIVFGLIYLATRLQHKFNKKYLSQCIVGIFCLLLLIPSCVAFATENDIVQPLKITQNNPSNLANDHFSETDMAMFSTIKGILPSKAYYTSDIRAVRYINTFISDAKTGYSSAPHAIRMNNLFLKNCISNKYNKKYQIIFFREKHFMERGLYTYDNKNNLINFFATPETLSRLQSNLRVHNTIYANGGDCVYAI